MHIHNWQAEEKISKRNRTCTNASIWKWRNNFCGKKERINKWKFFWNYVYAQMNRWLIYQLIWFVCAFTCMYAVPICMGSRARIRVLSQRKHCAIELIFIPSSMLRLCNVKYHHIRSKIGQPHTHTHTPWIPSPITTNNISGPGRLSHLFFS